MMKRVIGGVLLGAFAAGNSLFAEGVFYPGSGPGQGYGPDQFNWPPPGGSYESQLYNEGYPSYPSYPSYSSYPAWPTYDYAPYYGYESDYYPQPDPYSSVYPYDYGYVVPAPNSYRPDPAYDYDPGYDGYSTDAPQFQGMPHGYLQPEDAVQPGEIPQEPAERGYGAPVSPDQSSMETGAGQAAGYAAGLEPGYPIVVVPPPNLPLVDYSDMPPPPPSPDWRTARELQVIETLPEHSSPVEEIPPPNIPGADFSRMPPPPPSSDWRPAREMQVIESLPESSSPAQE